MIRAPRWLPALPACLLAACLGSAATPTPLPPTFVPAIPAIGDRLAPTLVPFLARANPGVSARYTFTVKLDYVGKRAEVAQLVEVTNPGPDEWNELVFYLPADLRTERFTLSKLTLVEQVQALAPRIEVRDGFLTVRLPAPVRPNESRLVNITYGLSSKETSLRARRTAGDVGHTANVMQFLNWYPQLVPYERGRGWKKWQLTNVGPPLLSEVADYDLEVTSARELVIASGGPVASVPGLANFRLRNARSIAFSASPEYQLIIRPSDSATLYLYHLPDHAEGAAAVLAAAAKALQLFNELFGPYPYASLVIAEDAFLPSVASGGFLLHTGQGFADYDGKPESLLLALVPQAMAHLWWGQVVGHDPVAEPWLGAALPMYSEYLYIERFQPELKDWYWRDRVEYWKPSGALNRTAYDLDNTEDLLQNTYRRGAQFLNDLRLEIGVGPFNIFLRDLYQTGAFRLTTGAEFFGLLTQAAPANLELLARKYFDAALLLPTPLPTITPFFTPGAQPTATPQLRIHVVQAGETLAYIAGKYAVPLQLIVTRNRLADAAMISVGQELIIPYP